MLNRIRAEWLAKKAELDPDFADKLATEIETNWWNEYGEAFLMDVKR